MMSCSCGWENDGWTILAILEEFSCLFMTLSMRGEKFLSFVWFWNLEWIFLDVLMKFLGHTEVRS